jgi:hypothetical protein
VIDSFMGKLTLQDGTIVGAVLNVSDDTLTVAAEGMSVGTWPLKYCRVSRLNESEFVITIDGEPTTFHPVDAFRFAKAAAELFSASALADRINVIRNMPLDPEVVASQHVSVPVEEPRNDSTPRVPLTIAALVVAVAILITLGGRAVLDTTLVPETVVEVTTTIRTVDAPSGPEVFTLTPDAFRTRWNEVATVIGPELMLDGPFGPGEFSEDLSDLVLLTGTVGADGTVESIKLSITPTEDADQTQFGLAAIGMTMATADPSMGDFERTELLRSLGFSGFPRTFLLDSPQGEVADGGIRYQIRYVDLPVASDLLLFSLWEDTPVE